MDFISHLSSYSYADMRIAEVNSLSIRITDDEVKTVSGSASGFSVRVLVSGSWGFSSANKKPTGKLLESLLKKAESLAKIGRGNVSIVNPATEKKNIIAEFSECFPEDKIKTLKDASKEMKSPLIKGRTISCSDAVLKKEFYNSEGAEIIQEQVYTYLSCASIAKSRGQIQRGYETGHSRSGFKKIDVHKVAATSRKKAERLLKAEQPPKGRFTVILDNEMTGVFSHEAVGHACEADSVLDRESILQDKIGQNIGVGAVTIIDDPSACDFGQYTYDDEGILGKKTELVKKGVLNNYINSLSSASSLSSAPNGHARAAGYDFFPIVRMSNTYFQPGKDSLEDIFDVPYGIYVKGMKGGSVDIFSGGFMFKAEEAYEIKKGEKTRLLCDVTLSGNILETLHAIELVGKDFATNPGICGKFSQEAPVSDGGPHIRVTEMMVG